jgi:hypothetical protein
MPHFGSRQRAQAAVGQDSRQNIFRTLVLRPSTSLKMMGVISRCLSIVVFQETTAE